MPSPNRTPRPRADRAVPGGEGVTAPAPTDGPRVIEVEDQGMWRGRHTWRVVMEDADGRSSVNAHGDTEAQALDHAQTTFANRHRWTAEQRAAFRRNAQAFNRSFGGGQ